MSLVAMLKGKGPSGFGYGSTAEEVTSGIDLYGKTFLLTGCNSGLGLETLRVLTQRGARILATARTQEKAAQACRSASANTLGLACELSEPDSIRSCIDSVLHQEHPLDGIICNAGIMALPKLNQKLGYELQFWTNHIGHFRLVTGLLDKLGADGRVVILSSSAHTAAPSEGIQFDNLSGDKGYTPWKAYGQSKLANLLFAKQLAKRFEGTSKTANAVHPGVIPTNLGRSMPSFAQTALKVMAPLALKTPAQGAATQCYVAVHPDAAQLSGQYFSDCNVAKPSRLATDAALAERLWQVSQEIVAKT